jgi:pimeloyl-ACP methyl ester carboxylesterase
MARQVLPPLRSGWMIIDGEPLHHRVGGLDTGGSAMVHVHGFGISGTYLEPTAAVLARRHPTFVPDLPGSGLSRRPRQPLDIPGMARTLVAYLDDVGLADATFVGNSLGCVVLVELAASYPDRITSAVLVSPAGGPNNLPMTRALWQMTRDAVQEPPSLWPIATRDYLRFGVARSWSLFRAMTAYPTLERLRLLDIPTLVVGGSRDPLVDFERVSVFSGLPHVDAVRIPGPHALNYSRPDAIADLVEAHLDGRDLSRVGPEVEVLTVPSSDDRP